MGPVKSGGRLLWVGSVRSILRTDPAQPLTTAGKELNDQSRSSSIYLYVVFVPRTTGCTAVVVLIGSLRVFNSGKTSDAHSTMPGIIYYTVSSDLFYINSSNNYPFSAL